MAKLIKTFKVAGLFFQIMLCEIWHSHFLSCMVALRPYVSSPSDHIDDNLSQWKQAFVQQAASQVVLVLFVSKFI